MDSQDRLEELRIRIQCVTWIFVVAFALALIGCLALAVMGIGFRESLPQELTTVVIIIGIIGAPFSACFLVGFQRHNKFIIKTFLVLQVLSIAVISLSEFLSSGNVAASGGIYGS